MIVIRTFDNYKQQSSPLQSRKYLIWIGISVLILMLPGCAYFTSADAPPKTIIIPEQWTATSDSEKLPIKPWTQEFSGIELNKMIQEAYNQNPNIQYLIAGVSIAEEQVWISGSTMLPQIDAGISGNRSQRSNISGFSVSSPRSTTYGFNLGFLWEIDLWYKLGNELEAAQHDQTAAESDLQAAKLSLAANITKTWVDGIVADQQVELTRKTISSFKNALDIIEQGYDRGIYNALDVHLARTSWLNAQGREQGFLRIKDEATRTLESSLGRYPSGTLIFPDQLPIVTEALPNSLPSSLLERRPDIIAATERFYASDQRMLKARKNMLPTIQFSGSGGTSTKKFSEIFNPEFLIWNIAGKPYSTTISWWPIDCRAQSG